MYRVVAMAEMNVTAPTLEDALAAARNITSGKDVLDSCEIQDTECTLVSISTGEWM